MTQGAVGFGAAAVLPPPERPSYALLGKQLALVRGLHRHIVALGFMDFAMELHDRRRFRHPGGTGRQRGRSVLRQGFIFKMQTAANLACLTVSLRLNRQPALDRERVPRLFHLPLRPLHPAHGIVVLGAGGGGGILRCRGSVVAGLGRHVLKLQPPVF